MNLDVLDYFCLVMGVGSIIQGIYSIRKKTYSHEHPSPWSAEIDKKYSGGEAITFGIFWLMVGVFICGAYLLDGFGVIDTSGIRQYLRDFMSSGG